MTEREIAQKVLLKLEGLREDLEAIANASLGDLTNPLLSLAMQRLAIKTDDIGRLVQGLVDSCR